jgi:hypothetical protein
MTTIDNIEGALKDSFLNILADNAGLIMRTADLKNKYLESLKQYENIDIESLEHKYSNKNYVQIFKNLTGSNVKNTTNLLRDKNVNWYYGKGEYGNISLIEAKCIGSTQLPLGFDEIRAHGNNYFIFFNNDVSNDHQLHDEITTLTSLKDSISDDTKLTQEIITKSRNMKLQKIFRNSCLTKDNFKCAVDGCEVSDEHLLIASHIIPVSAIIKDKNMSISQKILYITSDSNGLTLCPNHDALLDKNYITFSSDNSIIFHKKINNDNRKSLNVSGVTKLKKHRSDDEKMKQNFEMLRKVFLS